MAMKDAKFQEVIRSLTWQRQLISVGNERGFEHETRPSVRVNWVACLYVLYKTNLGMFSSNNEA